MYSYLVNKQLLSYLLQLATYTQILIKRHIATYTQILIKRHIATYTQILIKRHIATYTQILIKRHIAALVLDDKINNFSQVTFEQDSRQHYLKLLGYDPTELAKKVNYHSHYYCMINDVLC